MLVGTDDRIAFPMPDLLTPFDRLIAFGNMAFPGQHASRIMAVVPLAPQLGHDPHVSEQRTSGFFVAQDVAIDRFMTDTPSTRNTQGSADLFRTPFLAQQGFDFAPLVGTEPGSASRGTPTRGSTEVTGS